MRLSQPLRSVLEHSDCDFGHGREHLRRLHSGDVGIRVIELQVDPNLKTVLFTLKNPHNVPVRRFALKAEKNDWAISCSSREKYPSAK
jgi:hypothetical protein